MYKFTITDAYLDYFVKGNGPVLTQDFTRDIVSLSYGKGTQITNDTIGSVSLNDYSPELTFPLYIRAASSPNGKEFNIEVADAVCIPTIDYNATWMAVTHNSNDNAIVLFKNFGVTPIVIKAGKPIYFTFPTNNSILKVI